MIIEHTSIKYQNRTHLVEVKERKEFKPCEGRRIVNQIPFTATTHKHPKPKIQTPSHFQQPQTDTFRGLFSKKDRQKESDGKIQSRHPKKANQDNKSDKNINNHNKSHQKSKSKSKSKVMGKSKSLKQLGKKSKSMIRLEVKQRKQYHFEKTTKEERKSESPQRHMKSTMSFVEKKNVNKSAHQYKSNYVSKTNRDYTSEVTTERQKSKGRLKTSQISKPSKKSKKPEQKKKNAQKQLADKKKVPEKQNVKIDKKVKVSRPKKDKKIIISQQNSKLRRNQYDEWQSSQNDDEFLSSKQKKEKKGKSKQSNIVQIPHRKQRLSLNPLFKRPIRQKNTRTQAEIEEENEKLMNLQYQAAVIIQKVFRGYLTRKYIRECFEHNAAITIQKAWRGYKQRCKLKKTIKQSKAQNNISKQQRERTILQREQYLLQKQSGQASLRNSQIYNEKWNSILEQILSEESVNGNIKKKIQQFLQKQKREIEFDYRSNRSSSAKSNISSQIIHNQINSQKHFMQSFIEQQRKKKKFPHMSVYVSPKNYMSPKRFPYNSPQYLINSPNFNIQERLDQSHELNSSQMLIQNLKNIQRFHKDRLLSKANNDKKQLNNMLIKNTLSPRTHEKKFKQVEQILENELSKFNESINEIVKNCILYKESPNQSPRNEAKRKKIQDIDFDEQNMITPKKQLAQLHSFYQMPEQCMNSQKLTEHETGVIANLKKLEEKSQQFCEYYKFHKEELKKQTIQSQFDTSYQFIEEYLINLIEFVRQYQNGEEVILILQSLKKPRSHSPETILSNMRIVTENSQQSQEQDNSFKLPMYKYIELDEEIIDSKLIEAFNESFPKLMMNEKGMRNELEEGFIKMIAECMNEALNSLRPTFYLFTDTQIKTVNAIKSMEKVPAFESENNSEEELQFQFMCALTLNKIFYWNKLEWGKIVNLKPEEGLGQDQMRQLCMQQLDYCLSQLVAKEEWVFCEQLMEIVGLLTEELFEIIVFQEIATIWDVFFQWNLKFERTFPINISIPHSKHFFEGI